MEINIEQVTNQIKCLDEQVKALLLIEDRPTRKEYLEVMMLSIRQLKAWAGMTDGTSENSLHKHCVNGCAYKNALISKTESMQEFARQNYGSVYYEGLLNGMRNMRVHIEKLYEKHCR